MAKTKQKMTDFLLDEHGLKKCEKLFQNIVCFCMLSCQDTVNTIVFGWFSLRTGSENMKKTVVFAVHLKPLVEKTSQNTVFSTRSLKNSGNSDVFGRFSSLTLQNRRKYQCFSFTSTKIAQNTVFLDVFDLKYLTRNNNNNNNNNNKEKGKGKGHYVWSLSVQSFSGPTI